MQISLYLSLLVATAAAAEARQMPRMRVTGDSILPNLHLPFHLQRFEPDEEPTEPARLAATAHVVSLQRKQGVSPSWSFVRRIRDQAMGVRVVEGENTGTAGLFPVSGGQVFVAALRVNDFDYATVVDTGSSDPWLANDNFTCSDPVSEETIPPELCFFGPTYNPSESSTFEPVPDEFFRVGYASGETLTGQLGLETVELGGIQVTEQKFGVVDRAAWYGDGVSSGLIGLASYFLTSAFSGNDPTVFAQDTRQPYDPIFVNMFQRFGVPAVFSMVLTRDTPQLELGGLLGLGGVPVVPHTPGFASAPIRIFGVNEEGESVYQFYEIPSEGFAVSASRSTQFNPHNTTNPAKQNLMGNGTHVIIDSGTSLVYLPDDVTEAVHAAYQPPAQFDDQTGFYTVDCEATAPVVGVQIGKKIFYINFADLVLPIDSLRSKCISGVQPSFGGLTILGDVWMKGVLSVFDIQSIQMQFAARKYYGLEEEPVVPTT